jgi:hypothetical protein
LAGGFFGDAGHGGSEACSMGEARDGRLREEETLNSFYFSNSRFQMPGKEVLWK